MFDVRRSSFQLLPLHSTFDVERSMFDVQSVRRLIRAIKPGGLILILSENSI